MADVTDEAGWAAWGACRPATTTLHLDTAAAGRPSEQTLAAAARHARLEAEVGAYVAQAQADDVLETLRADLAGLLGLPPAGLAFVESASAGLATLLRCWPLPDGARVGVVRAEWGPNLEAFAAHGCTLVELPSDPTGRIDPSAVEAVELVHLTHAASHRGLVQPVADAIAACGDVPVWVDVAQSLGHLDTADGAAAAYGTSRKWLCGPRGVGMVAIAERHWDMLRVERSAMHPGGLPAPAYLESHEAHVAGRIGLANAVREYLDAGPRAVQERLAEVGRLTRAVLADADGWAVAGSDAGAITALRPTRGQDVSATRATLLAEHGILTTAGGTARAPRDMTEPLLRVSPHVDCTLADLDRLRAALSMT